MRRSSEVPIGLGGTASGVALALFAVSGAGCSSERTLTPPVVGSVAIEGPSTLRVSDSAKAVAIVLDTAGTMLTPGRLSWQSSAPSIATVSEAGWIRALVPGVTRIIASTGDHEGTLDVTVLPAPGVAALVSVAPAHMALIAGDTVTLRGTPRTSTGDTLATGRVTWSSSDSSRARVDSVGKVTAIAPGRVTIIATYDGRVGTSEMVIHPAAASLQIIAPATTIPLRDSMQLTAVIRDSSGAILPDRPVEWKLLDPGAWMSASGLLKATIQGNVRVVATSANVADTIIMVVAGPRVAHVTVNAGAFFVAVGDTVRPLVRLYDSDVRDLFGRVVTWSSADTTIATAVDGVVTGRKAGRTKVTVQSEGLSKPFDVIVEDPPASIAFLLDSVRVKVGERVLPPVLLRDARGEVVRDYTVTYTTGDAAVATPTADGSVRGVGAGSTTLIARVGAIADTTRLIVSDADPISFSWNNWGTQVVLGERVRDIVHVGNTYTSPRTVRFRSSDPRIFTVTPDSAVVSGYTTFEVEGVGIGLGHLIVEVDGRMARHEVPVYAIALKSLEIIAAPAILRPTQSGAITTRMVDVNGAVRTYPLVWRSLNSALATVDGKGVVTGVSLGSVDIVAQHDTFADTVRISIQPDAAPTITGIAPAVLAPGNTAVIRGRNFSSAIASNQVTIAGVNAAVTSATETELTVVLPAGGYPCVPTGPARVIVTSSGLSGDTLHPLRSAPPQPALAVGQSIVLTGAAARCLELAPGGQIYLMTMSYGEPSANASTIVRVRGEGGTPLPAAASTARLADSVPVSRPVLDAVSPSNAIRALQANRHRDARAMLPALIRRFGAPSTVVSSSASAAPESSPSLSLKSPIAGEVLTLRVPLFEASNYCADYSTVHARVVYAGARALVLEDVDAPLARTMDDMYRRMGTDYETQMLSMVQNNFGNPLARDAELGQNGRMVLLFSRAVNDYGYFGVFYSPCDMYRRSTLPASNETPILYASVPDNAAMDYSALGTKANWRRLIRSPLVHQTAHLAMDAERMALGLAPQDLWLAEALASTAEELFMRSWTGSSWKVPSTYDRTLYCEVRPSLTQCQDRPYAMYDHFASLYFYAREHEKRTPMGPTSPDDATFPGSGWWLLRWAVDHYAVSENDFLKSLVRTPLQGGNALAMKTGVPLSQMLADMGMTLLIPYVVPFPVLRAQNTVPSWNWHNIFRGMEGDFGTFQGFPAQPRAYAFGSFDTGPMTMSGGEVMYLELWENQTKNQIISITGIGQPAPTSIALEIIRAR